MGAKNNWLVYWYKEPWCTNCFLAKKFSVGCFAYCEVLGWNKILGRPDALCSISNACFTKEKSQQQQKYSWWFNITVNHKEKQVQAPLDPHCAWYIWGKCPRPPTQTQNWPTVTVSTGVLQGTFKEYFFLPKSLLRIYSDKMIANYSVQTAHM